jgi:hypothetical protein
VDKLDLFQIHQTWTDLRQARVKDGFIFRVSRYFIDQWLRLLGPKAAWAVVDLQQRCYPRKTRFCQVSLKDLCAIAGTRSTTTMQAIVDKPLMRWFFAKRTTRQLRRGKVVRGKNRYDLQMSDPLTPEHQGQIAGLLAKRLRDGTVSEVRGPDDLIRLVSDLPPPSTLPPDELPAWATREPLNLRQIAFRVLSEAGIAGAQANLADETALRRAFADAQARITRPTRIALATHYFRTEWVTHLGATNAWLVMALRSRCYWNKESGELRDTCVISTQELADLLGTSTRTVIRGLQDPLVRRFAIAQERVYERRASDGRKTPARTRFQVRLAMDPLTPPDEEAFAEILLSDAARYGLDAATGQMNMLDILDMMGQMTSDKITHRRSQWGDKSEVRTPSNSESSDKNEIREPLLHEPVSRSSDKNETRSPATGPVAKPKTGSGDKTETRTIGSEPLLPPPSSPKGGFGSESSDKNVIRTVSGDKVEFRDSESSDKIGTASIESSDKIVKQYLNTFVNTPMDKESEKQQQYSVVAPALSLRQTLIHYNIEEPALSQILGNSQVTPELARAWMLYAENEPGLKRKAGYVIQRLSKSPPDVPADSDLLLVAGLSEDDLAGFARCRALELDTGANVSFGDERRETQYRAWLCFYGHERETIRDDFSGDKIALERDRGRAFRWQPDVG